MARPKPLASVTRALKIVEFLAQADQTGLPLAAIASGLEINKATAYATLYTLRDQRWVEQVESTGNYRLGDGIDVFARYQTSARQVRELIRPALTAICQDFNELVHLGSFSGYRVRYLDKVEPDQPVRVVSRVGEVAVAIQTALGRALIAASPERDRVLARCMTDPLLLTNPPEVTENLRSAVLDNFRRFDEHGWTQELGENQPSIRCVAVPLYFHGQPDFAISITTPQDRMPAEKRAEFARGITSEISTLPQNYGFTVAPVR